MSSANILLNRRVVFDGGMGTQISARGLDAVCPEMNLIEAYDAIRQIHEDYIAAGATVITTNTFGANHIKLSRHGLSDKAVELNRTGVRAVRDAIDRTGSDALIALDIGPTGKLLEPFGEMTYDEAYEAFRQQADCGVAEGANLCIIETMTSLLEGKIAALAARDAGLPFVLSYTFEENGRTLMGDTPQACAVAAERMGAMLLGTNCSGGPERMLPTIRAYREITDMPILCQPNAGLPIVSGGVTTFPYSPETMLPHMRALLDGGADAIGGCCGTTPGHIALFSTLGYSAITRTASSSHFITSSRETADLEAIGDLKSLQTLPISEAEDYDGEDPFIVDISGEEPEDIFEMLNSACSMVYAPMLFTGDDRAILDEVLRRYNGATISV